MKKGRLEAFSDGVIAIIITIMVLELHVPHGEGLRDLGPLIPVALSYVLSFVLVGIYWNNHHHMLYACTRVNGAILWANLNLLFWLSLMPFGTAWMGESHFAKWPVVLYGGILIMNGIAYTILCNLLVKEAGPNSPLALALSRDWKGMTSIAIYAAAIAVAFLNPLLAFGMYVGVAMLWLIPDRRIERNVAREDGAE
ncbi:MAG TPA: TMEM175 family protein [Puia sp.]|uniref:TMEM175 family protein n=1 Tax=Puia sp. TaxID=2045100 RepID=UPI002CE22EA4|nr:TMEM175 family protein [Puia sp.]HVU94532.1 TMEM175 family protein [Puia sp.]